MTPTTLASHTRPSTSLDIMLGVVVWCLLAATTLTPNGVELATLFFLLGPLIAVPLALELATRLTPTEGQSSSFLAARRAQPVAAWAAAASFMATDPWYAGGFALAWTALTLVVAGDGVRRAYRARPAALTDLCLGAASLYLGASGVMFALARFDYAPLEVKVVDVLGASTQFQLAGFCTLVIAASARLVPKLVARRDDCATERLRQDDPSTRTRDAFCIAAAALGPMLLATGVCLAWRPVEWAGLLCITAGVAYIVGKQLAYAKATWLALSSVAAFVGIGMTAITTSTKLLRLAPLHTPGEHTLDQMLVLHGAAMAVAFVLASLVGWTHALRRESPEVVSPEVVSTPEALLDDSMPLAAPCNYLDDNQSGRKMATLIMATAAVSLVYRILVFGHLEQTSALFIGIPSILAILLALTPPARTASGMMFKGITLALLASGALLGEGFICIIMAAPLFYGIALLVLFIDRYVKRRSHVLLALMPLLPLSLEGVIDPLSFPRAEEILVARSVVATPEAVENALSRTPNFDLPLPFALNIGFPRPESTSGQGLQVGDRRIIGFAGGEGKPGDLVLEVAERDHNRVLFRRLSDTSHIAHWLDWRDAEVVWSPRGAETAVRLTLRFDRRLDPAWYFRPLERYFVGQAGSYLVDTIATP